MRNPNLVQYLRADQDDASYHVAKTTPSMRTASLKPAHAGGGYQEGIRFLLTERIAALVALGEVRFFQA